MMDIACIVCSAAWVVALGGMWIVEGAGSRPGWAKALLMFVVGASIGAWAAEDRVCEIAERKAEAKP